LLALVRAIVSPLSSTIRTRRSGGAAAADAAAGRSGSARVSASPDPAFCWGRGE
jgi:hypothetical protein